MASVVVLSYALHCEGNVAYRQWPRSPGELLDLKIDMAIVSALGDSGDSWQGGPENPGIAIARNSEIGVGEV
jgi:hypothetical protein